MAGIERHHHRVGGLRWHWRSAGSADAPPLVLLHASPRHSAMFEPWMATLAADWQVIAPDTPGYGASDALPAPPATLADYVPHLAAFVHAVAGPRCVVYGTATGAQLGIALALQQPGLLRHLVLDNAAHFDDEEADAMLARYFPDLTPRADGTHLADAWRMAAQMLEYFPWYAADEAHRIGTAPAPGVVHGLLLELLAAGKGYAQAYTCAFAHERAHNVQRLTVPTSLLRWAGSILLPHIDRLLEHPLPACVQVQHMPAASSERYAAMTAHLQALARRAR